MELRQHDIEYKPRTTIKAQALADFIAECTFTTPIVPESLEGTTTPERVWTLYVDESVAHEKYGAWMILTSPEGFEVRQAVRFTFRLTNNEAEYEAHISGMKLAQSLEVKSLEDFSDSQLVVRHFSGEYDQKEDRLRKYASLVRQLSSEFQNFKLFGVSREDNILADALSRLGTAEAKTLEGSVYFVETAGSSVQHIEVNMIHQFKIG